MLKNSENHTIYLLRITGLLAIAGMGCIFLSDYKLLYMPLSVKEYSTFRAAMNHSKEFILFYSKLAVCSTPFVLFGLYHINMALADTQKILARVTLGCFLYSYINAGIYYAHLAYVMLTAHLVVPLKMEIPYITKYMYFLFQVQYYMGIIAGSVLFFVAVNFFKGNKYPRWYIYFNPINLIGLFRVVLPLGTPPILSGFFLTVSFNLVMLVTMIFSTALLWNGSGMKSKIPEMIPAG